MIHSHTQTFQYLSKYSVDFFDECSGDVLINYIPRNVALGELYAKYSLFDAHAGNSCCFIAPPSASSSSSRFHGNCVSVTVGVVTLVSPASENLTFVEKAEKTN